MILSTIKKIKFHKLSLIQKFILTYCILILVPLGILFAYTYTKMSKISYDNILNLSEQSFLQSKDFIDYKLFRIFDISNSIVIDNQLVDILMKDPDSYLLNEQISDLYKLRDFASSYEHNNNINNVSIYVNDNFIYSNDKENIFKISDLKDTKYLNYIDKNNIRFLWFNKSTYDSSDSNKYLSLLKSIKNPSDFADDIGYLILNFEKEEINNIVNRINSIDGSISYIVDSNGNIIVSSAPEALENDYIDIDIVKYYADNHLKLSKTNIDNNNIYIQSSMLNKTDWYLVNYLPESILLSEINTQRLYLIFLAVFCGTTSIIIAILFVKLINNRLSKVVEGMREVNNGNFDYYIEDNSDDELGELTRTYNYMIKTISKLNKEQFQIGKAVKNAELKALQSQINPHFLYNTLDMINWMSYKNQNEEIRIAIKNLAKFYKLSLNKGHDLITINDELQHSSLYIQIQNMRYNNRINLNINVDGAIQASTIPKITLQPIIENAINHGILAKGGGSGSIIISGYIEDNDIVLQISDDGIGIKEELIPLILKDKPLNSTGSGYGLKNINTRLNLLYGSNYGLTFSKNNPHGTTVTIRIPKSN